MNQEEIKDYLTGRGWIYLPDMPEGKRWRNPKNKVGFGMRSAFKWQLEIDQAVIRTFKCQGCYGVFDTRLDSQRFCSYCGQKGKQKTKSQIEQGHPVNIAFSLVEKMRALAKQQKKTLREIAESLVQAGIDAQEARQ